MSAREVRFSANASTTFGNTIS